MKRHSICLGFLASLSVQAAENQEKFEVSGKRLSIEPSSTTVIGEEQLEVFKTTDLNRALKTVPGIQIQEEDGFGLRPNIGMRGAHPHRSRKILIMEDGIPSGPAPYAAPAAYYVPAMSMMEGLEITKGSSAVRYGPQTIGGSINMLTRKIPLAPWQSSVDLAAGSYGFKKAIVSSGGSSGDLGWLLLVSDVGSDGFKSLPIGGKTGFHKQDFLGKLRYQIEDKHALELKYVWSKEYSAETYLGLALDDFKKDPFDRYAASQRDHMQNNHGSIALKYDYDAESLKQNVTVYQNIFDRRWSKLNGFSDHSIDVRDVLLNPERDEHAYNILRGVENSLGIDDSIEIGNNHRSYYARGVSWEGHLSSAVSEGVSNELELGLRFHTDGIHRDHTLDFFAMQHGTLLETGVPTETSTQDKVRAETFAAYFWDTLTVDRWSFSAGFRQEWVAFVDENLNEENDTNRTKLTASMPGAGVFYRITPQYAFLFGVYRGMGLSAGDTIGGDFKPEESINYESGFRWMEKNSQANLIGFWNDYKNIQGTCSFSEGCSAADVDKVFNGGKALIYGVESNFNHKFLADEKLSFPLDLQYTLTRASFQSDFNSQLADWGAGPVHSGDPLPYVPQHQATIGSGVNYANLGFNLLWNWKSQSYDQAVVQGRAELPSTRYLDAALRYNVNQDWQVYTNVDNALNEKAVVSYRPFGARPGKARTLVWGFKGSF